MGMVEGYLDSLAAHLPDAMRQDVRDELEGSIREQMEDRESQRGRPLHDDEIEDLLRGLGHPMRVASAYLPGQHLVGSDAFPAYKRALKIVLTWVLGIHVLVSLPFLFTGGDFGSGLLAMAADLVENAVWVFAVVTAVFYLLERDPGSLDGLYKWSPRKLAEAKPRLEIHRLEIGFEFLIEVVFIAWWNGLWSFPATLGDQVQVHIGMSSQWSSVFWVVNGLCGLSILMSLYKFAKGGWDRISLVGGVLIHLAELGVVAKILSFEFLTVLQGAREAGADSETLARVAELFAQSVVWVIAIIIVVDMAGSIRKLMKLRKTG